MGHRFDERGLCAGHPAGAPRTRGTRREIRPTGQERTFGVDELIVSKTDPRGVITYANDVFLRVSGYEMDEVVGRPHNLIRHPDMPRAVFQLLWDTLSSGRELFAYINNLAQDGAHYWVLAHVTPSYGPGGRVIGYHSNRRRPSPRAVQQLQPLSPGCSPRSAGTRTRRRPWRCRPSC